MEEAGQDWICILIYCSLFVNAKGLLSLCLPRTLLGRASTERSKIWWYWLRWQRIASAGNWDRMGLQKTLPGEISSFVMAAQALRDIPNVILIGTTWDLDLNLDRIDFYDSKLSQLMLWYVFSFTRILLYVP